jgi:hypothetical protein
MDYFRKVKGEKMICEADMTKPYSKGEYNKFDDKEQWIRLSEGCPNGCPYCREAYENPILKVFEIPELVRNEVKILDMNLLCHPEALEIIRDLGRRKVNGKVIYYELLCGVDYRFLTQEIASALKQARFSNIRIAWDFSFSLQKIIKERTKFLLNAGYSPKDIMIFVICNWKTTYEENLRKMDLCKVWGFQMADCYFDNQLSPNIKPIHWTEEQIKSFRSKVRKHNMLVNFGIDPEEKEILIGSKI